MTVKRTLKIISSILMILFLIPTFLVSCSGEEKSVSVLNITFGMKSQYGDTIVKANPIAAIAFLLPLALLVLWCNRKKLQDNILAIATAAIGAVDFIVWIVIRAKVKGFAEENYCEYKTLWPFFLNITLLIIVIGLGGLLIVNMINPDTDIIKFITSNGKESGVASTTLTMPGWTCPTCNNVLDISAKFCNKCGSAKPDEEVKMNSKFCYACGSQIANNAKFCLKCGANQEQIQG